MKRVFDLSETEARDYFLKSSSYFNSDLPPYLSFDKILNEVASTLNGNSFSSIQQSKPSHLENVNYKLISNKDGRFAWRQFELMHPVVYVSLVDLICESQNWTEIKKRISEFEGGIVECCSDPVISIDQESDTATQVKSWWKRIEQRSLEYSLEFSHLLHTDVTDCYGSLYTHSIAWAIHGLPNAKDSTQDNKLLGNKIDAHIRAGRYGQTNGISQGSTLMDFIAELVLRYVDWLINEDLKDRSNIRVLRYRDDYRIFANSDESAESVLKVISDKLRSVGMRLGVSKTFIYQNVVEGAVKPDKIAGMKLQDLGNEQAKTLQKRLLRLHSFSQQYPNSGAIRRLMSDLHTDIFNQTEAPDDLEVQIAIAADIGSVSPSTFPAVAGIVSHLLSLANTELKSQIWEKVRTKMNRVPYNGYLEIWLQRIVKPESVNLPFESSEAICRIVDGHSDQLWESSWISSKRVLDAIKVGKILISEASKAKEVIVPDEIRLFKEKAWAY